MRLIDAHKLTDHLQMVQKRDGLWGAIDRVVMEVIDRFVREEPTVDAASPWHRVEDELPEIGKIVLVYDDWDRLSICQLDKHYRWLRQGGGWFDVPYVRYWMPIEPPKEDA